MKLYQKLKNSDRLLYYQWRVVVMEFLGLILLAIYFYAADQSNYYLKYHLLNTRAEFYSNTEDYIVNRFIWAVILGWATIPIALIPYVAKSKKE